MRQQDIRKNRATNYGVVRPELLDSLYEAMYHQRLKEPDEDKWQYRIVPRRLVAGYQTLKDGRLQLRTTNVVTSETSTIGDGFDLIITATGYTRQAHEVLLEPTRHLLESGEYQVGRNYRVKYHPGVVAEDCGIWLQGCCEGSHGVSASLVNIPIVLVEGTNFSLRQLSDTLLSILAVRAGEIVDSLFT